MVCTRSNFEMSIIFGISLLVLGHNVNESSLLRVLSMQLTNDKDVDADNS